jgi:hypothetical protein
MKLHAIYNPNRKGPELRVHAAGCADIKRDLRGATSDTVNDHESVEDCAEDFYQDFIAEGSMTVEDAIGYSEFLPCTNPKKEATMTTTATAPKSGRRTPAKAPARGTPKATPAKVPAKAKTTPAKAKATPAPAKTPPAAKAPKVDKRAAKQDLAQRVLLAISDMLENSDGSETFRADMSVDDAGYTVAQWLHHLPTGRDSSGQREWPGTMPRPDRSDWK